MKEMITADATYVGGKLIIMQKRAGILVYIRVKYKTKG